MSIESARAFLAKMKNDAEFRKIIVQKDSEEQRREWAKAQGFRFTKEELDRVMDELSPEELDLVMGGRLPGENAGAGRHPAYRLFTRTRLW